MDDLRSKLFTSQQMTETLRSGSLPIKEVFGGEFRIINLCKVCLTDIKQIKEFTNITVNGLLKSDATQIKNNRKVYGGMLSKSLNSSKGKCKLTSPSQFFQVADCRCI